METNKEELTQIENPESIDNKTINDNKDEIEKIDSVENVENVENVKETKFLPYNPENQKQSKDIFVIFGILVLIFSLIVILSIMIYLYTNSKNDKIFSGINIKGVNVSGLTKTQACEKVNNYINDNLQEEIKLKHLEYEISIPTSELNIKFDVENAVNTAFDLGRTGSFLENNLNILKLKITNTNIEPDFSIDETQLKNNLEDISSKLPDKIIDSSYYIENNNLVITKGKSGQIVSVDEMIVNIKNEIYNLNLKDNFIDIITKTKNPEEINIESIHNEVYKEPKDAYYTQNPFTVYPSENGLDFNATLDEAKEFLKQESGEYIIPLKILYPKVTTNMIGSEAFPDLLSNFSTKYATSNKKRTTNLVLASNIINGTVLMPGETFSYNTVVGERTIAAGYKEAAIYVNGEVVDGLGGGICQIATTLYNAAVYANLDIVERRNHQFVPSYVGASRDATVVYGSTDFKFKNNRNYPIKIACSVSGGIANFKIFGLRTDNEYDIEITSRVTKSTSNSINSEAYKILKQNGQVVGTQLLSKDVYKKH